MTRISCLQRLLVSTAVAVSAALFPAGFGIGSLAGAETYDPPRAALAGFVRSTTPQRVDVAPAIDLVIELQPKDRSLETLAAQAVDPASAVHRLPMSKAAFNARFGRSQSEINSLVAWLHAHNASDVYASPNRLVVGGYLTLDDARRALNVRFDVFQKGERQIVAPVGPITIPAVGIRAVRGTVAAYAPRLADVPTLPTDFRGAWFPPVRFRAGYDAAPGGGAGQVIALIEDSSDRFDLADVDPFVTGKDAGLDMLFGAANTSPTPPIAAFGEAFGLQASRVHEDDLVTPNSDQGCGREDRGQEADMDVDAELTLAPMATLDLRYDRVCVRGGEGLVAIQRTLDANQQPDIIVFPFNVGPVLGPTAQTWGPTPVPYLEAAVRGIAMIVPAGDDGALGYKVAGTSQPGLAYPCVLAVVICVGGTQLGIRSGTTFDEGPWNDGLHAGGGGITWDPRPSWQSAPSAYEFSKTFDLANHRMVPDVSADASGHLQIFWHGYGLGGVGGTSESAAIVAGQIATINAAVPKEHRIISAGDLYALAISHPEAFRHITRENDRGYYDNTIRPKPLPPPLGFHGVLPSPPPTVLGCPNVQPRGCDVRTGASEGGYNPVTGIGSIKEQTAIDALR